MATVLCVLYDDPVDGYPLGVLARRHPGRSSATSTGRTTPSPRRSTSLPAACSGASPASSACGASSRRTGTRFIVTSDKDGADSAFERELPDADVVISQPFWPAYLTAERIAKAPNLKLAITAGIGSDHVDLKAAIEHGITVAEVTYSNSISVSEHVVMMILAPGAQLHPVVPVGRRRRLEHRRLRPALVRPRRHAGRHGRGGPDRLRRPAPAEAVRGGSALHRPAPSASRDRGASSASPTTRPSSRWLRFATSSRSTRRCIPRPSTCSTTSSSGR